jgi:hypothetical protein
LIFILFLEQKEEEPKEPEKTGKCN